MPLDLISRKLLLGNPNHGPIALMYHSVQEGRRSPSWRWAVSMARFREQLDLLQASGWSTICIRDLPAADPHASRLAAITFDDGYADNFAAFREIERRGMRATWFVVSGDVGRASGWTSTGAKPRPMLSAEQLRLMDSAGMEIGSHTCTHSRLTEVDGQTVQQELRQSRAELEGILGKEIHSFAYPYGKYDPQTVEAVRAAGYRAACTTRSGWALRDGDPLRIRRVTVFAGDNLSTFARKLAFADNDVSWGRLARYAASRLAARIAD
ncbi:MAG: polysaccharide deacetylase family protein [Pseudomonadota bacterium]